MEEIAITLFGMSLLYVIFRELVLVFLGLIMIGLWGGRLMDLAAWIS